MLSIIAIVALTSLITFNCVMMKRDDNRLLIIAKEFKIEESIV